MQYIRSIIRFRMHLKVTNCLFKLSTYHSHSETLNKGNEQEMYVSFIVLFKWCQKLTIGLLEEECDGL